MSNYQQQQHQQHQQQQQCRGNDVHDGLNCFEEQDDDEQSIIDVFEFDDTTQDRWLCSTGTGSRRNSAEIKVQDLVAWLHADVIEPENTHSDNILRKNIDSRTFTRIKRRSNKLNFEQIEASVSPEMSFSLSNVWKNQTISESPSEEQNIQNERKDNVPMMLRPKTNQVLAALLSESPSSISSQTSMEAFMNMAQSKEGINSVLSDTSEPNINHFLMNISQPSLLYSSIISDGKGEDSIQAGLNDSFVDSQILTDSMMEASMFKEVQDTTMLAEFLKQSNDSTIFEDKTVYKSLNSTFASEKTFDYNLLNDEVNSNINLNTNETFTNCALDVLDENDTYSTKIITLQENVLNSLQVNTDTCNMLNNTKVISPDHDTPVLQQSKNILSMTCLTNKENEIDLMNKSSSTSSLSEEQLAVTPQKSNVSTIQIPHIHGLTENCRNSLDTTFNAIPTLRAELLQEVQRSAANKFDVTLENVQLPDIEAKLDITYNCLNTNNPIDESEVLDATYVQALSPHSLESQNVKKSVEITNDFIQTNSKFSNIGGTQHIDYTKKNSAEFQIHLLDQNRFNTFRKDSKIGSRLTMISQENYSNKTITPVLLQSVAPSIKNNDNLYQQRFNTFSKKMSTMKNKICIENNNVNESKGENKFSKPVDKLPRQIQAPRQLSKLPQLFQKSNPNLGTNLKSTGKFTLESNIEFSKGSQPNISRDTTSRSMESIESTASVHSAPDIDDTLSICSESSRASYTIKSQNFDKFVSTAEQDKKLDILKPKIKRHHILENTWVEDKNLPSPILKSNVRSYAESADSRSTSPSDSTEFTAKTSSPLTISPANSDQAINKIESDDGGTEVVKENIQVTVNVKSKQIKVPSTIPSMINTTKLRQPTNWAAVPNKIANNAVSGIPRPASRIPALKFARPNLK